MAPQSEVSKPGDREAEAIPALPKERLYRPADLSVLAFNTTADVAPLPGSLDRPQVYQPLAKEAIRLGRVH